MARNIGLSLARVRRTRGRDAGLECARNKADFHDRHGRWVRYVYCDEVDFACVSLEREGLAVTGGTASQRAENFPTAAFCQRTRACASSRDINHNLLES
jgi:hypothetical protein